MRRPLHSAGLLLRERSWLIGFAMESVGFLLYAAALALAELALVQSIAAGGIGVLAFASARLARRRLRRRELTGVLISIVGLIALGISLAGGSSTAGQGNTATILLWLGVTAGVAIVVIWPGRKLVGVAVAYGIAGGLLFSIGDIATKLATEGGVRLGFIIPLILGYTGGTALLQIGYQAGGALTVAADPSAARAHRLALLTGGVNEMSTEFVDMSRYGTTSDDTKLSESPLTIGDSVPGRYGRYHDSVRS